MPRLLMFDIDGTLTATDRVDADCYVRVMSEHLGVAIDADWRRYRHVTDSGIAAELFEANRRPPGELPAVRRRFVELLEQALRATPGCCEQVPGAAGFLARVRRTPGWVVALATGGWGGSARAKLRHAGIDADGLAFASADDAEARVDIMTACLARAADAAASAGDGADGHVFSGVTYVGDGDWDVAAARQLGWGFVGIGPHLCAARLRRPAPAYPAFPNFTDPAAVLDAAAAVASPAATR